jgi:hypothetical protein
MMCNLIYMTSNLKVVNVRYLELVLALDVDYKI